MKLEHLFPLASRSLRRASLLVAAGVACANLSQAQEVFGRWEDDPLLGPSIEFFVSPQGNDVTGAGTPASPWRSVTMALGIAGQIWGDPGVFQPPPPPLPIRITINVAPGSYNAAFGEEFPLRCPAHGLSLETWPNGAAPPADRPLIDAGGSGAAILVDWIGPETMPATVIQTLEIQNAGPAIQIDPSLQPVQVPPLPTVPLAVEVRQNFIHDCAPGMELVTADGFVSTYVVEDNDLGDETPILQRAILETNAGVASTLYRSNRVQLYEEGVAVLGNGPETTVPRLFSNFVQTGERLVTLDNCGSFVINNTIAFAVDFTAVPVVNGLTANGGTLELHNNILWCPVTPIGIPAIDLTSSAATNAVTNLIEDAATGVVPSFVGGDAHPGQVATDLHLLPISAMIGAGTIAQAIDPVNTVRSAIAGGVAVRTDVTVDNDLDGRLFLSAVEPGPVATVDIGGDEFLALSPGGLPECRITVPATATQDQFGNVLAQPINPMNPNDRTWLADLQLSGPPNGVWFLVLGFGYFDVTLDPTLGVLTQNGSIYQNLVPGPAGGLPTLGNVTVDLLGGPATQVTATSGAFDALGQAFLPAFVMGNGDVSFQELEWTFQLTTIDPVTNRLAASNRIKIELNDRP